MVINLIEFKVFFELYYKLSIFMLLHDPQLHINYNLFNNVSSDIIPVNV